MEGRTTVLKKIVALVACTAVITLTGITSAEARPFSAPRHLRATSVTPTTLTLRWNAVRKAPAYRVQLSTRPTMRGSSYHRFTRSHGTIRGLAPRQRYYFRVAVINPRSGARLSRTSVTAPPRTLPGVPVPTGLHATRTTESTISLAWKRSPGASGYRVAASTSARFTAVRFARSRGTSTTVTGLRNGTTYFLRVQATGPDGAAASPFTRTLTGHTVAVQPRLPKPSTASGPTDVRVASYNVASVSLDKRKAGQQPWAQRRVGVISDILGQRADVVGLQEANQSSHFASSLPDGKTQFLDLRNGLNKAGGSYALTNEYSFNCVTPTTANGCIHQDWGASSSTRILYNTDTIRLVSQGSVKYAAQAASIPDSYLAYAVLRTRATGQDFLFTSTHLSPRLESVRRTQWHQLIAEVNDLKGNLPVINVGDFNTTKFTPPAGEMLAAMRAAGYGDALGQQYQVNPGPSPRAVRGVNTWVNSLNRYQRDVAQFGYENRRDKLGNGIDWIFATNALVVKEYEVVLDFDPETLQMRGTIPSDHNMVRATITLP